MSATRRTWCRILAGTAKAEAHVEAARQLAGRLDLKGGWEMDNAVQAVADLRRRVTAELDGPARTERDGQ